MKGLLAVSKVSVQALFRTRMVLVLVLFLVLSSIFLPLTVVSDGTARGLVQIGFSYSLGLNALILAIAGLGLAATGVADDIESYRIHMIRTKAIRPGEYWFGKWLGISSILILLAFLGAVASYAIIMFRIQRLPLSGAERKILDSSTLTARRRFGPSPIDYRTWAEREYHRRIAAGAKTPKQVKKSMVIDSIIQQLKKGEGDIPFSGFRPWEIHNLPRLNPNDSFFLRYRVYVNRVKEKEQRRTRGLWVFENPKARDVREQEISLPVEVMGGTIQELRLPGWLIGPDRALRFRFINLDPEGKTLVIPRSDGPFVLVGAYPFWYNYLRTFLLIALQIAVAVALGCLAGASLSSPVAIFLSVAYLMISFLLSFMQVLDEQDMLWGNDNLILTAFNLFRRLMGFITFSLNGNLQIDSLIDGVFIETSLLLKVIGQSLAVHLLPMALLGIYVFKKRELGLVIRR